MGTNWLPKLIMLGIAGLLTGGLYLLDRSQDEPRFGLAGSRLYQDLMPQVEGPRPIVPVNQKIAVPG